MKQLLKITVILFVLASVAASCHPDQEYPKALSYTEYSLPTSCQWQSLPYDEKVIMINSNEELKQYVSYTEGSYPVIDFSKHSLLLTNGYVNHKISTTIVNVKQVSSAKFILNLELALKYTDKTVPWNMALLVEKLNDDSNVKLNLTLKEPKIMKPVIVTDENIINFFDKTLPYDSSPCFNIPVDTCILINSVSEFQQSYKCTYDLPEIDFDKFTLVIGKKKRGYDNTYITGQKMIEDNVLTLLLRIHSGGGVDGGYFMSYWGIYPKLPDKPFYVEYEYENI